MTGIISLDHSSRTSERSLADNRRERAGPKLRVHQETRALINNSKENPHPDVKENGDALIVLLHVRW